MSDDMTLKDLTLILPFTEEILGKVRDIVEPRLILVEPTASAIIELIRAIGEAASAGNLCPIQLAHGVSIEVRQDLNESKIVEALAAVCVLPDLDPFKPYSARPTKQERRARQRGYRERERNRSFKS